MSDFELLFESDSADMRFVDAASPDLPADISGSNSNSSAYKLEAVKLSISGLFSKAKYIASDFSGAFIAPARAFLFNALSGTERICCSEATAEAVYIGSCIISAGKASDTDDTVSLQEVLNKEVKTKTRTPRSRICMFLLFYSSF